MVKTVVGVVGLGYVGLPLAVDFAEAGCAVIAVDLDERKVEAVSRGESYIEDVSSERLAEVRHAIRASTTFDALAGVDAVIVCVPTPLTANREPDLAPLIAAGRALAPFIRRGQTVVLESTTYPGTTREIFGPLLEADGLACGTDFHLAFSPERVDPGRTDFTMRTTPKVVGGLTEACGDAAERLYGAVCDQIVRVTSPEVAELTKLHENIFRSVNIAMVNEMSILCDRMKIDVWEVVDAASTKPYGFMRFEPGPGMGGHCLPVDPFYLSWRARQFDMSTEFIELAGKVNQHMPYYCVQQVSRALNGRDRSVSGARVTLLGVSYKAGVGDIRESPALKMISLLKEMGAHVSYHDRYVPRLGEHGLEHVELDEALDRADAVVIVTAHPDLDYRAIAADSTAAVIDLRGALRERLVQAPPRAPVASEEASGRPARAGVGA